MDPITLGRFAQLTARLEQCRSREAFLEQNGIPLDFWLSEQKRWLEEITKRVALQQPRLFWQFLALVEMERLRLGLPTRMGQRVHSGSPHRIAGGVSNDDQDPLEEYLALDIPGADPEFGTVGGIPRYLRVDPVSPPLAPPPRVSPVVQDAHVAGPGDGRAEIPTFIRAGRSALPAAPVSASTPDPSPATRVQHATQKVAASTPVRSAAAPYLAPVLQVALPGRVDATPTARASSPNDAIIGPPPAEPQPPATRQPAFVDPPRLQMSEYAEVTSLLEEGTMEQAQLVLGRWNMDLGSWFDEVAYWNRMLAEDRQQREAFERMLAAHHQ